MEPILLIETTTTNCSVGIVDTSTRKILSSISNNDDALNHAELLPNFINQVVDSSGITVQQLVAVAISRGPGSYTGLRIGTSLAKGMCMALNIPLLSISTLEAMALSIDSTNYNLVVPMLDARRMEVYAQLFESSDTKLIPKSEVVAEVITEQYFEQFNGVQVVLVGPGASKLKELLTNFPAVDLIDGVFPDAIFMASLAVDAYLQNQFEDLAYFEPFYLKDFVALKSKKSLLG